MSERSGPALSVGLVVGLAGVADAQVFNAGPGTFIAQETVDTAGSGPRTNVDETSPAALPAGTYQATQFNFVAGQTGNVSPFLAISTGTNEYQILAVGDNVTISGVGSGSVAFGGSDTFTLAAPATVYGGITNTDASAQNPIYTDLGTGLTDHDAVALDPHRFTVGGVLEGAGFSNANENRAYAFGIRIDLVPEPASLGLLALGGCGLLARRRRRQS